MHDPSLAGTPKEARWSCLEPRRDVEPNLAKRLLQCAFPGCSIAELEPLNGGYRNANFKVRLDASAPSSVVLRIYEHDAALCRKEVDLMRLVAGTVPVADVLYANTGTHRDLPPFAILKFVEGMTLRELKRLGESKAVAEAAFASGRVLADLGKFSFPKTGWLSAGMEVTTPLLEGDDPVPRFVDLCLASPHVQRRLRADVRSRLHDLVWSWAARLRELDSQTSLVHCDFGMRNLLVREEQGKWRVAALLDWEFAVSGSPLIDVAHFLRYELRGSPLLEPHFSRGFLEAGGVLPSDWRQLCRVIDVSALVDTLVRAELPSDVEREIIELIHATIEDRDPCM